MADYMFIRNLVQSIDKPHRGEAPNGIVDKDEVSAARSKGIPAIEGKSINQIIEEMDKKVKDAEQAVAGVQGVPALQNMQALQGVQNADNKNDGNDVVKRRKMWIG